MSHAQSRADTVGELLLCLGGPLIWAAHFFLLYGAETLVCLRGTAGGGTPLLVFGIASTAIAMVALLGLMTWQLVREGRLSNAGDPPRGSRFLRGASIMLGAAALLAVAWGALPALMLPACSGAAI